MYAPMWAELIEVKELCEPVKYELEKLKISNRRILRVFAWGWEDDDYTHVVVVLKDGHAFMIEGASLRPTIVTGLA